MRPDFPITVPNYAEYECRKQEAAAAGLTPVEYQAAIAKIARECGV